MPAERNASSDPSTRNGDMRYAMTAPGSVEHVPALGLERYLLRAVLEQLGRPPMCLILWDGSSVVPRDVEPECSLHVADRGALWALVKNPEYQFPAMYVQGRVGRGDDLERVLEVVHRTRRNVDPKSLRRRLYAALMRPRPGSLASARENIHSHYDLGNEFYKLWLDEKMVYTCAYFPTPEASLEMAQTAKMDLVCRKLRLRSGERVVEAGCGWGALALHMARHYGVKVRAFNISNEQLEWAREQAAEQRLDDVVEFVEGDYREIDGRYDAFVSVGMLEHVGPRHYPELAGVMDRCLPSDGRGLVHTIGTDRPGPLNPWIERHIFPGAYPPSLGEMMPLFGPRGFSILDVENMRLHYARTLGLWRKRFEGVEDAVLKRFGQEFVRAWRFYLVSSEMAFKTGQLQLFQVLFARKGSNRIPWSRSHVYRDGLF